LLSSPPKPVVTQETALWKDVTELLPYYHVEWQSNRIDVVSVGVSGITGRIAGLENRSGVPTIAKPANYLELRGLPENTVFVRRKSLSPGQPVYEAFPP
jgi:hypothetical protein